MSLDEMLENSKASLLPVEFDLEEQIWRDERGQMDYSITALTHLSNSEFENWIARLRAARLYGRHA